MPKIKHIFFDFDNTIWDFEKNSQEALNELFIKYGIARKSNSTFKEFLAIYKAFNANMWHLYSTNKATKEEIRFERFNKVFKYYDIHDEALAYKWDEEYLQSSPNKTNLVDGALDLLEYLKPNYKLYVITNGFKEVQETKLTNCNLNKYFDKIIISEEYGFHKPDVELFRMAEILTSSNHDECVMIGDNYDTDIEGAINANWKSFYFSKKEDTETHESTITVKHLSELKNYL